MGERNNTVDQWAGKLLCLSLLIIFTCFTAPAQAADTTPPLAPVLVPPVSPNSGGWTLSVKFILSETGGAVECKLGNDDSWHKDLCVPFTALPPYPPGVPKPDGKTGYFGIGGMTEGSYTLYMRQTDAAGNVGPTASASWVIDQTAPAKPTLSGSPSNITNKTAAVTISISNAEKNASYSFSLDGGNTWTPYGTKPSYNFAKQTNGTGYRIQARQKDQAGNVSEDSEAAGWFVDTQAPPAPSVRTPWNPTSLTDRQEIEFSLREQSDWTGPSQVQCQLDGGSWIDCKGDKSAGGIFTTGTLKEGKHTLLVRQIDAAGNISSPGSATWIVDVTGPGAPSISQIATPTTSRSAVVKFILSESSFMFPMCKIDQGEWQNCNLTESPVGPIKGGVINLDNIEQGPHSISIKSYDIAGNEGKVATMNWVVDSWPPIPPEIESVPAFTTQKQRTIQFNLDEPGGKVLCNLDSKSWLPCTSVSGLSGTFNTGTLADGLHTLRVRQIDQAGNYMEAGWGENPRGIRTWTVDTKPPAVPNFSITPAYTNQADNNTVLFNLGETNTTAACNWNNEGWQDCSIPGPIDGSDGPPMTVGVVWHQHLDDGSYSLQVKSTDRAGNISPTGSFTVVIDTQAPLAPAILSGPAQGSRTKGATASFPFAGEVGASFQCSLDLADFAKCSSPNAIKGLKPGDHTMQVKQIDRAGNESGIIVRGWTSTA